MNIALDRIDLRILAELQREARISNAELAERVSLSPSASLRRVQRLEQSGVIQGYGARVDPHKIGLRLEAFVRVQLEKHGTASVKRFTEAIAAWEEVVACWALTGDMDFHAPRPCGRSRAFPPRFVMERLLDTAGVADVNSSFVLATVKRARGLPLSAAQRLLAE